MGACPSTQCTSEKCSAHRDSLCAYVGSQAVNQWKKTNLQNEQNTAIDAWKKANLQNEQNTAIDAWKKANLQQEKDDAINTWKKAHLQQEKDDAVDAYQIAHTPPEPVPGYTMIGKGRCNDWSNHYVVCAGALDGKSCSVKATTLNECKHECDKRTYCGEFYFEKSNTFDGYCNGYDESSKLVTSKDNPGTLLEKHNRCRNSCAGHGGYMLYEVKDKYYGRCFCTDKLDSSCPERHHADRKGWYTYQISKCYLANGNCTTNPDAKDLQAHYKKNRNTSLNVGWRPISRSSYCHDIKSHQVLTGNETVGWLEVDTPTHTEQVSKTMFHGTYEECKNHCASLDDCVGVEMRVTGGPETCTIINDYKGLHKTGNYFRSVVQRKSDTASSPIIVYAEFKSAMKVRVLKQATEDDCRATCDATEGCNEYYYDESEKTCQLADGGCLDKVPVDDLNAFQYRCNNDQGTQVGSYQIYDATSLTDSQKKMISDAYPDKKPSYYACKQGCANPDKNCQSIGVKNGLGQPSLLEKTRHANLRHASKMKMVPISDNARDYKDGAQLQLTETFDGQCDIVESDAKAVELCTRSPLCDGFWRYNNTTHKNRTCFKTGARPATWNKTPSMNWSGRYFQRGYSDPDLRGELQTLSGFWGTSLWNGALKSWKNDAAYTKDPKTCFAMCDKNEQCSGATYNADKNECWHRTGDSTYFLEGISGDVGYKK